MTNVEFFREFTPQLLELEAVCMGMDDRTYEEFKRDVMEGCDAQVRAFLMSALSMIDEKRKGKMEYE